MTRRFGRGHDDSGAGAPCTSPSCIIRSRRAFDLPPVSRAGDANTVFATGGANYRQTAGASYREVIDLGDFDNSVAINVPGQSAQPGSEYYDDLLPLWGNDKYFPLVFSRARVEAETKHVLRLAPSVGNRE